MLPLTGNIEQVPPMYSALKHEGQRLYKLARQGIEVERKARPVCIESFKLIEFQSGPSASAVFDVDCTKGTYIRTLIADLGQSLGCGATVEVLRRTRSGKFEESLALSETELDAELTASSLDKIDLHLLPTECLMERFDRVDLDEQATKFFMLGQAVMLPKAYRFGVEEDIVRVFREEGDSKGLFLGAGQLVSSGSGQMLVQPKRLRSDINQIDYCNKISILEIIQTAICKYARVSSIFLTHILEEIKMALSAEEKNAIVVKYGKNETDTGSTEVQVALLTANINKLQGHFGDHNKDHHSRRGLIRMVNQRRKLLDYLKSKNAPSYVELIKSLGLRR